jgi:hypothetical protein
VKKKWTQQDIKNLNLKSNINELPKKKNSDILKNKHLIKGKISIEKESIKTILWIYKRDGLIKDYVEELQFDPNRKFRFDWAIPYLMIAIEYEGIFSKKSRHTTISGFSKDTEKYNSAAILGWTVLRYTAMTYKNLDNDLKKLLELK